MSLDVSLIRKFHVSYDGGKTLEEKEEEVYENNITHNLNKMAIAAGIYEACWRPENIGAIYAKDIVDILQKGYDDMVARPEYFKKYNSPNGWGMYKHFLPWVKKYIDACLEFPDAIIFVGR